MFAWSVLATAPSFATPSIETEAPHALVIDANTKAVLLRKGATEPMYPASMTKLMTAYIVFEHLRDGKLSLTDRLTVSERAWRKGGSKMFVRVGSSVLVEDLLRGIIVQSGNDACIVVAEALAGSEEAFAEMMTEKAQELGMNNTTFKNATGWPDPEHKTTAADLARLALTILDEFPEFYEYYSQREFTYNDIRQFNRNPLLRGVQGADGMKTGHTSDAGYGLVGSAIRDGRRLVLVIGGLDSVKARSQESKKLIEWGFRSFQNYQVIAANKPVKEAPVWLGEVNKLPLVLKAPAVLTLPSGTGELKIEAVYQKPLKAPIMAGDQVGELQISADALEQPYLFPLVAAKDVAEVGFFDALQQKFTYYAFGELP